jgi:hypothetical protein
VSRNEILAHVSKAMEGLRCGPGQYRDAAALALWLEMRGMNGLTQLLQSVDIDISASFLEYPAHGDQSTEMRLDMAGKSTFIDGPLVMDMACVGATRLEMAGIELLNCRHPFALLACAVTASQRGFHSVLHWRTTDPVRTEFLALVTAGSAEPELYFWDAPAEFNAASSSALLHCSQNASAVTKLVADTIDGREQPTVQTSPEEFASRNLNALEHGVKVESAAWEVLKELGHRLLVEETEESRIRGAGPGS